MDAKFVEGGVYESNTHGFVRYCGLDHYMGQTTLKFESITYGGMHYWLPTTLGTHFEKTDTPKQP